MKIPHNVCTTSIETFYTLGNDLPGFLKFCKDFFLNRTTNGSQSLKPYLIYDLENIILLYYAMLWSQITIRSSMPDVMEI